MVTRREFLAAAGFGCGALALGGCTAPESEPGPAAGSAARPGPFELEDVTIAELQDRMASGEMSSREIVEAYLERIQQIDGAGPELKSVIEVNPDAIAIADQLDQERASTGSRGPLHGIPILIKDNIDTADGMMTTAGSLALVGPAPERDAFIVERLRAAGVVLLGKTNLSEWANFRSTRSSSGWSARGGQTRNPYVLDRNPCGSSSGSGAAASANLCAGAIGTETDGSIVCPSSTNGIVGIKPTIGLVSRFGIVPIAASQDTAGPMARTVSDAVALLSVLVGGDPRDPETARSEGRLPQGGYFSALDAEGMRGARIGVARDRFGFHERVDQLMERAIEDMRALGAEIVDPAGIEANPGSAEFEVLLYEFKAGINAYLDERKPASGVRTLEDLIAFNVENADRELHYFGQEIFESAQQKGPLTEEAYREALATCRRLARTEGIDATMDEHHLDAIVAPTGGPAWPIDLVNGDHFLGGSSTAAAVAGYPNITVPAGFVFGLPVGISFFGRAFAEPTLIRIAYAFEQATGHREPPTFAPTLSFGG